MTYLSSEPFCVCNQIACYLCSSQRTSLDIVHTIEGGFDIAKTLGNPAVVKPVFIFLTLSYFFKSNTTGTNLYPQPASLSSISPSHTVLLSIFHQPYVAGFRQSQTADMPHPAHPHPPHTLGYKKSPPGSQGAHRTHS